MAEQDDDERRSGEREPTSADLSISQGGQPDGADEGAPPSSDAPPAEEPAAEPAEEPAAEAEGDEPAEQAAGDAEGGDAVAELPPGSSFPIPVLFALLGAAVVLFLVVLLACVHLWRTPAEAGAAEGAGDLVITGEGEAQELPAPEQIAGLSYGELTEKAGHCEKAADHAGAALLYRAAAEREEEGLPKVLLARHRLAWALMRAGRHGEAMHVVESLRAVSRPGDELWKNAVLAAIAIQQAQGRRDDFNRSLYLLRANSHRYGDEQALNRWIAYVQALAAVEDVLERRRDGRSVYGVEPPPFGRAPYGGRPLLAEDIVPVSGKYGDGTLEASCRLGEVTLLSEGAPVGEVLDALAAAAGLQVDCRAPEHYAVVASIDGLPPRQCLEVVLGSVGLKLATEGDGLVALPARTQAVSARDALEAALWGLQEFLILCPDSPELPEAYYALGHLYMTQGQRPMALDQLGVLAREFPRSPWTVFARYVEGRASCEQGDWRRGKRELLWVADGCADAVLVRSAFLWAAQCQRELGEYAQAVSCFRRALADEVADPLSPSILYNIAYCLEKSGASPLEVEERYMELRTRYPTSDQAREADYRLARMMLDAGDFWKAASRYEVYLESWPASDERGRRACADLLLCYVRSADYVRAILLGEVMRHAFGSEPEYGRALPLIVEAYEQSHMQRLGLAALDSSLAVTEDRAARCLLMTEKARFMVALNMCKEARETLGGLAEEAESPEQRARVRLVEAALLMAEGESQQGVELCRQTALKCTAQPVRERALRMLGAHYRATSQFDKAVLAYSGRCPPASAGGTP